MGLFIDRSNVNGPDNLKVAGVSFLYVKATEGTTFKDATFVARRAAAWTDQAKVGAYHFAGHGTAVAECDFFLSVIGKPKPGELRPCLDLESGQSVTWAEAWISNFKVKMGYYPAFYASTSVGAPMRRASAIISACPWWRAEYGPNDGLLHPLEGGAMGASAHQYTSVLRHAGISGDTDASVLLHPTNMLVPAPASGLAPLTAAAWAWGQWWLGIGPYAGHGHYQWLHHVPHSAAPSTAGTTMAGRFRAVAWYLAHGARKP